MKVLLDALARHARILICATWFLGLLHLIQDRTFERFLRPEFGLLLAFGLLAVLALGAAETGRRREKARANFSGALRGLLLLAPLLYLPATSGVALDSADFDKRWTGFTGGRPIPNQAARSPSFLMPSTMGGQEETTLLDLCMDAETYNGQIVEVTGMLKQLPEITETWGPDAMVLYRFVISCCVADAIPAAILITGGPERPWPDDTWVRVKGRFTLEPHEEEELMRLAAEQIEPCEVPYRPYLF